MELVVMYTPLSPDVFSGPMVHLNVLAIAAPGSRSA
jgi:hypothetical protein